MNALSCLANGWLGILFGLLVFSSGCRRDKPLHYPRQMELILQRLALEEKYPVAFIRNDLGVKHLKEQGIHTPEQEIALAYQELFSGQYDSALVHFHQTAQKLDAYLIQQPSLASLLYRSIALCWNRKAERMNCRNSEVGSVCIMPFQPDALYQDTAWIDSAIFYYNLALRFSPNDPFALWLKSTAMEARGKPSGFPFQRYSSGTHPVKFKNKSMEWLQAEEHHLGGAIIEDFDNDGFQDVMTGAYLYQEKMELWFGGPNGRFQKAGASCGLGKIVATAHLVTCDYNNDGFRDVYVIRGGWLGEAGIRPNSLLKNNGNRSFTEVTIPSGLLHLSPSHSATWADFNGDGREDLFVGHEHYDPNAPDQYSRLYLSRSNGTFTECARECGIELNEYVKGVMFIDFDRDLKQDILISVYGGPNRLYRNTGNDAHGFPRFENVAKSAGIEKPVYSFSLVALDYDQDGWEDLMIPGYTVEDSVSLTNEYLNRTPPLHPVLVYHNERNGTFREVSLELQLNRSIYAMGINVTDPDNDGFQDVYLATGNGHFQSVWPNVLLQNDRGKSFKDITAASGLGSIQKGHSVATGDLNNDGHEDIFLEQGGFLTDDRFRNALFINQGNSNVSFSLKLSGTKSCRSATGTRIRVTLHTDTGTVVLHRVAGIRTTYGCSSSSILIGIGKRTHRIEVQLTWPSGLVQTFKGIEAGKHYEFVEGNSRFKSTPRVPLKYQDRKGLVWCGPLEP